jgi:hypothetical protein
MSRILIIFVKVLEKFDVIEESNFLRYENLNKTRIRSKFGS